MGNLLGNEASLYLRQHAGNPVEWKPWGAAAFAEARERDVPVLVSIGYSSCHWCHVMERESFEDPYIARLMNRHFVCIKVDREERPDVDSVYMEAVQMIQGHGGWPLNVFCLPDQRPFFGGTYFPPGDRGNGLIPWPQLLMRIRDYFERNRAELEENAGNILANLRHLSASSPDGEHRWSRSLLLAGARNLLATLDAANGGFGGAPKFPPAMALSFLLQLRSAAAVDREPALASGIDSAIPFTLEAMVRSGLCDQAGGGFFRYCVDGAWTVPHFEKMLYDNGLLLSILARAHTRYPQARFAIAAEGIASWLEREMTAAEPDGTGEAPGLAAALDADSPGGEGRFYCWTPEEAEEAFPEVEPATLEAYGIRPGGNFEHGWSHLSFRRGDESTWHATDPFRAALLRYREARGRPALDPKRIASWNALAARGLAEAGFVFGVPEWVRRAADLLEWIENTFGTGSGILRSVAYPGGGVRPESFLVDTVHTAEAELALARALALEEPDAVDRWIDRAAGRIGAALEQFGGLEGPGLASTLQDGEAVLLRRKEWFDNATPSGNGSLVNCLAILAALRPESRWEEALAGLREVYAGYAERLANGVGHGLAALALEAVGLPVLKVGPQGDRVAAIEAVRRLPWRGTFVLPDAALPEPYLLCVGTTCLEPTRDLGSALASIGGNANVGSRSVNPTSP